MKQTKQKIYLETSVVSAYFDLKNQDPIRKAITREFWQDVLPAYQVFVGSITLIELTDMKKVPVELWKLLETIPELNITPRIEELTDAYLKANLFPRQKRPDAVHVATASVNKADFLVSWNQKHITRPHRAKLIQDFNYQHKIFIPEITTPEDLLLSHWEE